MTNAQRFPIKTALALATAVAVLAVVHRYDSGKGLSAAIFPEAAHVTLIRHDPSLAPAVNHPLNGIQQAQTVPHGPTPPSPCPTEGIASASNAPRQPRPPVSPYLIDPCGDLDPFFAALHALELPPQAGPPRVLTVLHYGDSPTTADLITGDVRDLLQQRFGDAGRGFLLTAKPWAWYQHRGIDISDKGWDISTAVGKGREAVYGIGGGAFEGSPGAESHITLKDAGQTAMEVSYLGGTGGGTLAVSANGVPLETFSTALDKTRPMWHTVNLPVGTKTVDLKPASGSVKLFGETFLSGRRGVIYDSLGLNGASTTVLSNGFNPGAWTAELDHTQPTLVLINYGTNESGFGSFVDKQYEPTLRTAIARIRTALPGVPILVMSPMDRGRRTGVDQIETFDTIPRIVAIQRRVAAEQNCAFFDTFNAMGGDGTMAHWYTGHPRLVAGDLIHPTPQGASIVAHLFVKDLALGYDRYLGHAPTPPPAAVAEAKVAPAHPPVDSKAAPPPANETIAKPKPSAAGEPIPLAPPASPVPTEPQPSPPQPVVTDPPQA